MPPLIDVALAEDRPVRDELLSLYGSVGWTAYTSDASICLCAVTFC